jgi:hypothetical protein
LQGGKSLYDGLTAMPTTPPAPTRDPHRPRRWLLTVVALGAAALHIVAPDVRIDAITLGLLVLAALPWLAPLIKSIEIPGVGKVELQEIERKVEEARGAADSAGKKADMALAGTPALAGAPAPTPATSRGPAPPPAASAPSPPAASPADPVAQLARLADTYNHIRETQPRGPARTGAMTTVLRQMMDLAPRLAAAGYDVTRALVDHDGGARLGAYAHLLARPDFDLLVPLVDSVTRKEDRPFGQYWGIQAIARLLAAGGTRKPPAPVLPALRALLGELRPDTDRAYELRRLLAAQTQGTEDDEDD